jgi:hypothetical protein
MNILKLFKHRIEPNQSNSLYNFSLNLLNKLDKKNANNISR